MSLQAAAAALNAPEALVQRSAEARAKATGASIDDILAAWAGGAPAPAAAPASAAAPAAPPSIGEESAGQEPTAPAQTQPAQSQPAAVPVARAATPATPPVLTGRKENPFATMVGAAAVFLLALVIGLFAPAEPEPGTGVRTSNIAFSGAGLDGRHRYLAENCAACHTQ